MTERELDRIIDGGLASYVADPVPGLEGRVMSRAGQGTRPTGFYWIFAAAAAVLAVMWVPQSVVVPMPATPVIAVAVSTPAAPVLPVARQVRRRAAVPVAHGVPMSAEERQLLEFATSHPELLQVFTDAPQQLNEPLSVEPIVIKPLVITSVGE